MIGQHGRLQTTGSETICFEEVSLWTAFSKYLYLYHYYYYCNLYIIDTGCRDVGSR